MSGQHDRWQCRACGRANPFYPPACLHWQCGARRPEPPALTEPVPQPDPVAVPATHNGKPVAPRQPTGLPKRTTPADPPLALSEYERAASGRVLAMALGDGWDFGEATA